MERIDLAILAAVPGEITALTDILAVRGSMEIAGNSFRLCRCGALSLLAGTTGIGKVNAAAVTAAILSRFGAVEVWNIGCAGAYAGSGLSVGDVLITDECVCGDEGILSHCGSISSGNIGIPLLTRAGSPYFDRFPREAFEPRRVAPALPEPGRWASDRMTEGAGSAAGGVKEFTLSYGPSLTVGMVSGDPETAAERFRIHGALAENMEGSAVAQVCLLFGAPFLECRGISNIAGVRDKGRWDFDSAIEHCHAVVRRLLKRA